LILKAQRRGKSTVLKFDLALAGKAKNVKGID
jgi:hypothetical protein